MRNDGNLRIGGKEFFVSRVLRREPVGLKYADDGSCEVFYGPLKLATITKRGRLRRGTRTSPMQTGPTGGPELDCNTTD